VRQRQVNESFFVFEVSSEAVRKSHAHRVDQAVEALIVGEVDSLKQPQRLVALDFLDDSGKQFDFVGLLVFVCSLLFLRSIVKRGGGDGACSHL
jgi:hypothetical protein